MSIANASQRVVTIAGSPSPTSRTALLAADVSERLRARGFDVSVLDVRAWDAAALFEGRVEGTLAAAVAEVAGADGIVLATPVYKASFTGVLKAFLDVLPQHAFENKPVLPLALGGSISSMLAIDYALRPVLASMHAGHVVSGVFALDASVHRRDDGTIELEADLEARVVAATDAFARSVHFVAAVK